MQAVIYKITPFDATIGTTIKFSWNGNQSFKNRCIIKTNDTNETVYDNTIETFKLEHTIDLEKATLENGKRYNAFITVFDKDDIESDIQPIGEPCLCLKTPVFTFTNITKDQVIRSSTYNFILSYSQENEELLDSWSISVYTRTHTLVSTSGVKYDTGQLNYVFSGFTNKNEYCVRAIGQTINGIPLDTGYIEFSVTYDIYSVFSILEPTNLKDIGAIQLRSNIVSSEGHLKNEPGVYIDGEFLDLKNNEVTYSEGFAFDGDFSLVLLFYGMEYNAEILTLYANEPIQFSAQVTYRTGKFGSDTIQQCFELKITSYGVESVYYSNKIKVLHGDDKIGLCITRTNGYYNIEATVYEYGSYNTWELVKDLTWGDVEGETWGYLAGEAT